MGPFSSVFPCCVSLLPEWAGSFGGAGLASVSQASEDWTGFRVRGDGF